MSYDITKELKLSKAPTLGEMLMQARIINPTVRAISLVREAKEGVPPALVFMMIGDDSIRRFGPCLKQHIDKNIQKPKHDETIIMSFQSTVAEIFAELERLGLQWGNLSTDKDLPGPRLLVCFIIGTSITPELCQVLTNLGCQTRLH